MIHYIYNGYISGIADSFKEAKSQMKENKCGTITKQKVSGEKITELKRWAYLTTGELVEVPLFNEKSLLEK